MGLCPKPRWGLEAPDPHLFRTKRRRPRFACNRLQDSPATAFICPDPDNCRLRLPRLFALLYDSDLARGACLASPGEEAVTVWGHPAARTPRCWKRCATARRCWQS